MAAGRVDTLVILGGNPVYNAPADLDFAAGALGWFGFASITAFTSTRPLSDATGIFPNRITWKAGATFAPSTERHPSFNLYSFRSTNTHALRTIGRNARQSESFELRDHSRLLAEAAPRFGFRGVLDGIRPPRNRRRFSAEADSSPRRLRTSMSALQVPDRLLRRRSKSCSGLIQPCSMADGRTTRGCKNCRNRSLN